MSLRSPLRRVTYLGSAKGGSGHWYAQRVTALALVLLGLWLFVSLATMGGASHEHVVAWLSSPVAAALGAVQAKARARPTAGGPIAWRLT